MSSWAPALPTAFCPLRATGGTVRALHVVSPSETALSLACSCQIPAHPRGSPLAVRAPSQLPEPSVQGPTLGFWGAGYVWPLSGSRSLLLLNPRARRSSETVAPTPRQAGPPPRARTASPGTKQ